MRVHGFSTRPSVFQRAHMQQTSNTTWEVTITAAVSDIVKQLGDGDEQDDIRQHAGVLDLGRIHAVSWLSRESTRQSAKYCMSLTSMQEHAATFSNIQQHWHGEQLLKLRHHACMDAQAVLLRDVSAAVVVRQHRHEQGTQNDSHCRQLEKEEGHACPAATI